jgi:hypothetical protein
MSCQSRHPSVVDFGLFDLYSEPQLKRTFSRFRQLVALR